jgi:hypothetical protein
VVADVALGVGVIALGIAAWLYLDWRSSASPRAAGSLPTDGVFHF